MWSLTRVQSCSVCWMVLSTLNSHWSQFALRSFTDFLKQAQHLTGSGSMSRVRTKRRAMQRDELPNQFPAGSRTGHHFQRSVIADLRSSAEWAWFQYVFYQGTITTDNIQWFHHKLFWLIYGQENICYYNRIAEAENIYNNSGFPKRLTLICPFL